ncbi:MAG TPA: OmpA family protein, partial [Bacillota bacterium]|nr:OmpA family protein [Bacillota bacterium]
TRAVNVVKYLIEENGINAYRLSASGYSDQHPVADNNTAEGRQKNRRVDMVILRDDIKDFNP